MITQFLSGLSEIVYPRVCLSCGQAIASAQQSHICSVCLSEGFSKPEVQQDHTILPNHVLFRSALWTFDHGGRLQNVLHHLKYHQMADLGRELGSQMAKQFDDHIQAILQEQKADAVIVPIPLHQRKRKVRGYNQARRLSLGLIDHLDIPLIPIDHVIRGRYTQTQTGFTMRQRLRNLRDAFEVRNASIIDGKITVIIDDVFTTGATTFELARTLQECGSQGSIILTLAEA
jgi:ComF family protein